MKNLKKPYTLIEFIVVFLMTFGSIGWVINLIKLVNCDFEPNWKEEILRGIGLIPFIGDFMGYFNS